MGKGTKEMLHKLLANQHLIMAHLNIKVPANGDSAATKKTIVKTAVKKSAPAKSAAPKKAQRKK